MPTAAAMLNHPDPLTREVARGYAGGAFLMDNGRGLEWYSSTRRALVPLGDIHIPRSLKKHLERFEVRLNSDFPGVLAGCMARQETWISPELAGIYLHLNHTGLVHSFETWQGGKLAGGVLGLALGGAFVGETMFHSVTQGSKVALVRLSQHLFRRGFSVLDAQMQNPHLQQFGTFEITPAEYAGQLRAALRQDVDLAPLDLPGAVSHPQQPPRPRSSRSA
ncbi:leucyl/phenylalanyl-tRNA--protein transferase [Deinococcus irradiatisoli]|uniref:Leucyl/phenylalanyl-tRNA--protein transferase n=1 Tax=Deinococcus irradiatisoli TaxID=2202254 RepID=A0A2Z3JE10_9DEIO|nr:leucyl/phenylalanyl-tRNA--protein transferase [Deinococcus irradiatisoli]AWN23282.1 leucyl/phenylalanyl-tRNA--protein transferase [Deinococcus irradiatisoli]